MVISSASRLTSTTRSQFQFYHISAPLTDTSYRVHDLENQWLYSNPTQYYDFLQNRVMIVFKPKFEEPDHDHPDFNLILSKKQNYDTVQLLVKLSQSLH